MATVAIPSEVFFTMAISSGTALISRAAASPESIVGGQPRIVMEGAELQGILGQAAHGVGGGPAKGSHPGMVQVNKPVGDREEPRYWLQRGR